MSSFTSLSSGGKHVPVRTGVEGMFREDGKNAERFVNRGAEFQRSQWKDLGGRGKGYGTGSARRNQNNGRRF